MTVQKIHPAVFSANLVAPIAAMIGEHPGATLFDPCAGLGWRLGEIAALCGMHPLGIDIEADLYIDHAADWVFQGDSTNLAFLTPGGMAAGCVSFVYPNGMADDFHAKDDSVRHTYIHQLRAELKDSAIELRPNNMAKTNPRRSKKALARFYEIQSLIIGETFKVLRPGAPFVVNTKDPDQVPDYTQTTLRQLLAAGFHIEAFEQVDARGMNHGANRERKADHENLTLARRPA